MSIDERPSRKRFASRTSKLPAASAEDVEYAQELADEDDLEAWERAEEADRRAFRYEGK
jgi:hypothetical protein